MAGAVQVSYRIAPPPNPSQLRLLARQRGACLLGAEPVVGPLSPSARNRSPTRVTLQMLECYETTKLNNATAPLALLPLSLPSAHPFLVKLNPNPNPTHPGSDLCLLILCSNDPSTTTTSVCATDGAALGEGEDEAVVVKVEVERSEREDEARRSRAGVDGGGS